MNTQKNKSISSAKLNEMLKNNVFELENGLNERLAEEKDVLPKGSIQSI